MRTKLTLQAWYASWDFYFNFASYSTLATVNKEVTCQGTLTLYKTLGPGSYSSSISQSFLESIQTLSPGDYANAITFPLSSYFSSAGTFLPPNCTIGLAGDPVLFVPVQHLTASSTFTNAPATTNHRTTSALPGSTVPPATPPVTAQPQLTSQPSAGDPPASDGHQGSEPSSVNGQGDGSAHVPEPSQGSSRPQ